ncbi:MAG: chromosomal replication initiator protein DnaA [Acidobacteria bacterium]|nr:chromosomal replication initiator protein DnaA [Acidobacteriota bacterium]MBK9528351.1 chromosomal replication initiator protein DnaA [Acidobacteriota bacterium]MBP7474365.1 chromosomal replication initiator protein DnaA [Pyrinomonadaceae bacterium]MBP9109260.1 chromosomal replication initiator protein DnaA [Pyrinomonadaceae bacterium]
MNEITQKTSVWNNVLDIVRSRVDEDIYNTWFRSLAFQGIDDETGFFHLKTGTVTKDWVCLYYQDLMDKAFAGAGFAGYSIKWEIDPDEVVPSQFEEEADTADLFFSPKNGPASVRPANAANFIDIEPVEENLNPKYTFEKFVVGSCNQFAHAAAKATAEAPGTTYNPLFMYGGVGLGKTHLMHAIGHHIKSQSPHLKVAYITSERFMNELINAIRFNKTPGFRDKYRSIDVLLLDDVQFMAGKERTQEEFFHTFNTLYNGQKQIVVTSDCPPREIPTLEERLHSRFEWGLIADLEPPDLETKVAILKRKADMDGIDLADDIAMYMAGRVKTNVRELEGSLVRLVAISSMRGVPLSKLLAQESMKNILDSERPAGLTLDHIARTVASHYRMSIEELKSKNNSRAIAVPRQVAMYLCKRLTRHSFPEIGREFGGKHHTTVMHSVDKIDTLTKTDRNFHKEINELIDNLCS